MEWGLIFPGRLPKLNAAVCGFLCGKNFLHGRNQNEAFQIGIFGYKGYKHLIDIGLFV